MLENLLHITVKRRGEILADSARLLLYTLFLHKKLRSDPNTESFLVSGDLEYSKFLNSFLTFS